MGEKGFFGGTVDFMESFNEFQMKWDLYQSQNLSLQFCLSYP